MDNWINLYRASHTLEAHALKGALEAEGVLVRLNGEGLSGALGELPVDMLQVTLMPRKLRAFIDFMIDNGAEFGIDKLL